MSASEMCQGLDQLLGKGRTYMTKTFFPEPEEPNIAWATRDEPLVDWLGRSTRPLAVNIRQFFNHNLRSLPIDYQVKFHRNLCTRWESAFFELVVARMIQLLGGEFTLEVENIAGCCPDFTARLAGENYVIEAIAPKFDQSANSQRKGHAEILEIIERNVPLGWGIRLRLLPDFDPAESKASLKRSLQQQFADLSRSEDQNDTRTISIDLPQGTLSFDLIKGSYGDSPIVGGPFYWSWSDTKSRLLHALKKKKKQVRSETAPVILAILASGNTSSFDDFDEVLLGREVMDVDENFREMETHFEPTGLFGRTGSSGSYAGVLAFAQLSPHSVKGPVLYTHPRLWRGSTVFSALEHRTINATGIVRTPAGSTDLLNGLRFAALE